jgi:hypothetical protein
MIDETQVQACAQDIFVASLRRLNVDANAYALRSEWLGASAPARWGVFPNALFVSGQPKTLGVSLHSRDGDVFDWVIVDALRVAVRLLALKPNAKPRMILKTLRGERND